MTKLGPWRGLGLEAQQGLDGGQGRASAWPEATPPARLAAVRGHDEVTSLTSVSASLSSFIHILIFHCYIGKCVLFTWIIQNLWATDFTLIMDYYLDTVHPGLGTGTHHDEGSDHGSSKRVFSRNSRIVHPNVSLSRCHSAWATQQSPVGAWHRLVLSFVFTWGPSITSPASEALIHPLNSTPGWFITH